MEICREIKIYSLSDPDTKKIRYVGKTIRSLGVRYSQHLSQAKYTIKKDYAHCWIKSLLNKNKKPIINLIELCKDINREEYWINYYRKQDKILTNINRGGEQDGSGTTRTEEQRRNISDGKLSSRKFEIYELDDQKNIIRTWYNYQPLSKYLDCSLAQVHTAIKRKVKIYNKFFLLKTDYEKIIPLFIVQDVLENQVLKFYNWKDIMNFFNLNSPGTIGKNSNKNKIYRDRYIITHNKKI